MKKAYQKKSYKLFRISFSSLPHFGHGIVTSWERVGNELKPNDFVWFDIIDINNSDSFDGVRFRYVYTKEEDVLVGLEEYHKCAKFCTSEKPPKKQKRNDYESSNSRK